MYFFLNNSINYTQRRRNPFMLRILSLFDFSLHSCRWRISRFFLFTINRNFLSFIYLHVHCLYALSLYLEQFLFYFIPKCQPNESKISRAPDEKKTLIKKRQQSKIKSTNYNLNRLVIFKIERETIKIFKTIVKTV